MTFQIIGHIAIYVFIWMVELFLILAGIRLYKHIKYLLYLKLMPQEMMRIHEAGHYLSYLQQCSHYNDRKYRKMLTKIERIAQGKAGGYVRDISNTWSPKKKLSLSAGMAAELAFQNKKMNRWQYFLHYHILGSRNDIDKLRYVFRLNKKQIIEQVNNTIDSFTEDDRKFIRTVEKSLAEKEMKYDKVDGEKLRILNRNDLFRLGEEYRRMTQISSSSFDTLQATSFQNS